MKISKIKSRPTLYFNSLNTGDLFEYEGNICMKIETNIDISINAVNLEQGTIITISNDEMIEPIYEEDYFFEVDYRL